MAITRASITVVEARAGCLTESEASLGITNHKEIQEERSFVAAMALIEFAMMTAASVHTGLITNLGLGCHKVKCC